MQLGFFRAFASRLYRGAQNRPPNAPATDRNSSQKRYFNTSTQRKSPYQKRLLLAALDWTRPKDPPMSLGQASILATLRQHNINVIAKSWSVNHIDFHVKQVCDFAMEHADEHTDFALGAFIWNERYTQQILSTLKANKFPGRIILGGPQVSYVKPGLNRKKLEDYYPNADVFIRGYAEEALTKLLLSNTHLQIIKGVHYAGEPDFGASATVDLEKLASPFLSGLIPAQPFIRWETQRGCPFQCSFCQHRESDITMKRQQFDKTRIMQEIDWIIANPTIKDIAVLDPTFNSGSHYLQTINVLAEKKYSGKISLQCRMEMVTDEFLAAVEKLNETAEVVLEFGLQTIHKAEATTIQRPNNLAKITKVLAETKQRKIATEVSLIFGLPGQTLKSFTESIEFCKTAQVPTIYAFPLMLLRGTPLYDQKHELGLIESTEIMPNQSVPNRIDQSTDSIPHVVQSPTFSYVDWLKMAELATGLDAYNAENKATSLPPKMLNTLRHTLWASQNEQAPRDTVKTEALTNTDSSSLKPR